MYANQSNDLWSCFKLKHPPLNTFLSGESEKYDWPGACSGDGTVRRIWTSPLFFHSSPNHTQGLFPCAQHHEWQSAQFYPFEWFYKLCTCLLQQVYCPTFECHHWEQLYCCLQTRCPNSFVYCRGVFRDFTSELWLKKLNWTHTYNANTEYMSNLSRTGTLLCQFPGTKSIFMWIKRSPSREFRGRGCVASPLLCAGCVKG